MIQDNLHKMMIEALRSKENIRKDNIKFLIGQFQTASKNKEKTVEDQEAVAITKKILKSVNDLTLPKILESGGKDCPAYMEAMDFIALCAEILPKEVSKEEIQEFINTIDFSSLKNKMQAIGLTNKHFNGNVDSALVKSLVENL